VESLNSSVQRRVASRAAGRASLKVLSRRSSFFALAIFLHLERLLRGQGFHSGFADFHGSILDAPAWPRVVLNMKNVTFIEIIHRVSQKNGRVSVTFEAQVRLRPASIAGTSARFCREEFANLHIPR
jgi:hypothetical protein